MHETLGNIQIEVLYLINFVYSFVVTNINVAHIWMIGMREDECVHWGAGNP